MTQTKDKRTEIKEAAKALAALIMDSPDRTITDEILNLARFIYSETEDYKGRKGQLSIEYQHLLIDYIDGQIQNLLCTSKEQAAAKLIGLSMFEDDDGRLPFRGYTPKSLVKVYNDLKENNNLFPSKKV